MHSDTLLAALHSPNLKELNFPEQVDYEKQSADDEKFVKDYPACKDSFGTFLSTLEHERIQRGGGTGGLDPLENHKLYGFI